MGLLSVEKLLWGPYCQLKGLSNRGRGRFEQICQLTHTRSFVVVLFVFVLFGACSYCVALTGTGLEL